MKKRVKSKQNTYKPVQTKDISNGRKIIFNFAYPFSFMSCKVKHFNNYFQNMNEFAEMFPGIMMNISVLSKYNFENITAKSDKVHFHLIEKNKMPIVKTIIENLIPKIDKKEYPNNLSYEQLFSGEEFYQIGLKKSIRYIGIINDNIFNVCFIDYFHQLYPNETKNKNNDKGRKYCPICIK